MIDKIFLLIFSLLFVTSLRFLIEFDSSLLLFTNIFFLIFYFINKIYKNDLKYYYFYYIFTVSRIIILYFFNFDLLISILLFLPEILGLSMYLIKLSAISMASLGSAIIFYFLFKIKLISYLLIAITFISILLTLEKFSIISVKYIPNLIKSYLKLIYYSFALNVLREKFYKKINDKIINIACWIQFLVVFVVALLNNIIIVSNTSFILTLLNIITFVIFTLILLSYLYYHKVKKINLLNIGYDIFIYWTEEFGYISKIALNFHNNHKERKKLPYFLKILFENKKFIYLVLITNLISIIFGSYTIFWILKYKILPIISKQIGYNLDFVSYLVVGYLLYTYLFNYYHSIKNYKIL